MSKQRLEAFSDGVIAIIITIMVLELKVPHGHAIKDLLALWPVFFSYVLSFMNVGIYWNNHHHMMHMTDHIDGRILWGNLHLLFWLSLVPFVTGWLGESHNEALPAALMGVVLLFSAIAFLILQQLIIAHQGPNSKLKAAVGHDRKGKISGALYASAIPAAFVHPWIADGLFVLVALIWLAPDRRIEHHLTATS
jgi:uncharacterized membrane protein